MKFAVKLTLIVFTLRFDNLLKPTYLSKSFGLSQRFEFKYGIKELF